VTIADPSVGIEQTFEAGQPSEGSWIDPAVGTSRTRRTYGFGTFMMAGAAYLVLSIGVWWNVWSSHPTSTTTCGCGDTSLFTWFLDWPAYALSHGLNPLYSTSLFHPGGINLLSNTSEVAIGVILAPVTWIFGPVATLNVALTLSPVLSALAMFVLLRRWVSWQPAAFLGGLFYGFSPLVLVYLGDAHLMVGMAMVPPLVVLCLDELLLRQRRGAITTGACLGLLVVLQFFLGTEVLAITAIGVAIGVVVLVLSAAARHPAELRQRSHHALVGLGAAGAVAVVLLAYPIAFALAGPAHLSGEIWPGYITGFGGVTWKGLLLPTAVSPSLTNFNHQLGGYEGETLSSQYFGLGALVVLVTGALIWRRDRRIWFFGVIAILSIPLALGLENDFWVPWRVLVKLPLIQNIIPNRFLIVTSLAVAVMLGVIIDHAHAAVVRKGGPSREASALAPRRARSSRVRWAAAAVGLGVAAIALLPPAVYLSQQLPLTTQAVELPDWFRTVGMHPGGHQVLLVYPAPFAIQQSAMTWQALDHMSFAMAGGGGPGSAYARAGSERAGQKVIAVNSLGFGNHVKDRSDILAARHALEGWGVTTVVIPDQPSLSPYQQVKSVPSAVALMTAAIGVPPLHQAHAWVWTGVDRAGPPVVPSVAMYQHCLGGLDGKGAATSSIPSCILDPGGAR
jgi:hypothetical protein